MTITLSPQTEIRLLEKAEREGRGISVVGVMPVGVTA